jgi:hypothetical protein
VNRPLFSLAFVAVLLGASLASASSDGQQIPTRPYASLYTPPEAVSAAVGGPGMVLADAAKATVVYEYTGGGPCGPNYDSSGMRDPVSSGSESGGIGIWLPVGIASAAVAGLGLVGFWLLRRSRV